MMKLIPNIWGMTSRLNVLKPIPSIWGMTFRYDGIWYRFNDAVWL